MNENYRSRYTIRITRSLLYKAAYISDYEGCSLNKFIEKIIRIRINEFQEIYGVITKEDLDFCKALKRIK